MAWLSGIARASSPGHRSIFDRVELNKSGFFYHEYNAAIYIDGSAHEDSQVLDEQISERLLVAGYVVIRFHHKQDWDAFFR